MNDILIAYKGFKSDMTCRGFQYELGKMYYEHGRPMICRHGFHACLIPAHVFNYYPYEDTEFKYAKVWLKEIDTQGIDELYHDSKVCGSMIMIDKKLISRRKMMRESYRIIHKLLRYYHLENNMPVPYVKMVQNFDFNLVWNYIALNISQQTGGLSWSKIFKLFGTSAEEIIK